MMHYGILINSPFRKRCKCSIIEPYGAQVEKMAPQLQLNSQTAVVGLMYKKWAGASEKVDNLMAIWDICDMGNNIMDIYKLFVV